MVTSLVSYICILPRPKERAIASRRASFVFTFVGTMSLVAIAAVWTTTVDPGRYNVDTCTDVLGTLTGVLGKLDFSQCKFSWRQGAVFSYIALGFGALSFLLDVRLLLEDGNKFCSCSEVRLGEGRGAKDGLSETTRIHIIYVRVSLLTTLSAPASLVAA